MQFEHAIQTITTSVAGALRTGARRGRVWLAVAAICMASPTFGQSANKPVTPPPAVGTSSVASTAAPSTAAVNPPVLPPGIQPPPGYVIGPEDTLSVVFWREKDMSADVSVRPDGKISLPLVNDIAAAGLTPDQLRAKVEEAASKFVEEPTTSIVIRAINSRKVFITGQVAKPGTYPLLSPTTVLQFIAMAGGISEYAKKDSIRIVRTESGKTVSHKFNYADVLEGKNLAQNIELKPGDTILVP